jgi:hypothetical protein
MTQEVSVLKLKIVVSRNWGKDTFRNGPTKGIFTWKLDDFIKELPNDAMLTLREQFALTHPHMGKSTSLAKRFQKKNHYSYQTNWCGQDDIYFRDFQRSTNYSVRKNRTRAVLKNMLKAGKTIICVSGSGYSNCCISNTPCRHYSTYSEYFVTDGIEIDGKLIEI